MIDQINLHSRRDRYGSKINRDHSPALAYGLPWVVIVLASLSPLLPVVASSPVLPPLGFIVFLAWQLMRPGLLPLWAGIPLGLVDDLFSGQPLGSGIMLWSLTMLALEIVESRFPWRGFWQDWLTAAGLISAYLLASFFIAGAPLGLHMLKILTPLVVVSVLVFPLFAQLVAGLDRVRLLRLRVIS